MKAKLLILSCAIAVPGLAQNTCFTNSQGTTICSHGGTVISGNTSGTGNSVYRDDRGNRLDFQTDQFGNASVQPSSGEPIHWSQPVLGERKYPDVESSQPLHKSGTGSLTGDLPDRANPGSPPAPAGNPHQAGN